MSLVQSKTLDRDGSATDAERRIRLLANIAAAQAEFGRVEEAMETCKTIARLRDRLVKAGVDPAVVGTAPRPSEA